MYNTFTSGAEVLHASDRASFVQGTYVKIFKFMVVYSLLTVTVHSLTHFCLLPIYCDRPWHRGRIFIETAKLAEAAV